MCGRYALRTSIPEIARILGAEGTLDVSPRYNIAPGLDVPVAVTRSDGVRRLGLMRWGLVPRWAKDVKIGYKMINARAETVADKPAFRRAFRHRRCLVPADGYYEWKRVDKRKQPYFIHLKDHRPFCFAGLWESWQPPDGGETLYTCTLMTTDANSLTAEVHHRMPVILGAEHYDAWLDRGITDPQILTPMLGPFPSEAMAFYPVSTEVNNARNDSERCVTPLSN